MRIGYLIILIFLGGCLVRTYTIERPRVDTTIEGNRGYIMGMPKESFSQRKIKKDIRKISVIEIELGEHKPEKERGYKSKPTIKREQPVLPSLKEEVSSLTRDKERREERMVEEISKSIPLGVSKQRYKRYTIKKGDTLQKISRKFYGTTKKWKFIYEENKDILRSPDKIYPGKTIKIPVLTE